MSRRKSYEFQDAPAEGQKKIWRSLEEFDALSADATSARARMKAEAEAERPGGFLATAGLLKKTGKALDPSVSRRGFIQFSTAAAAAFAIEGCARRPEANILPYAQSPESIVPGIPSHFATVTQRNGDALGIVVTSHDGRPTKVEGNALHPSSRGASDVRAQAAVWDLYDPDRAHSPTLRGEGGDAARAVKTYAEFDEAFGALVGALGAGAGLRVLSPATNSPSMLRVRAAVAARMPEAKFYTYDSVNDDNARAGTRLLLGQPMHVRYELTRARTVLALDCDFLGLETGSVRHGRGFGPGRAINAAQSDMSRLYAVEATHSITGGAADHRLALPAARVDAYARALGAALEVPGVEAGNTDGIPAEWIAGVAADLREAGRAAAVLVGRNQPPHVHALALAINAHLGAVGSTVLTSPVLDAEQPRSVDSIRALASEIEGASLLLVLGGNPVYDAPADVDFAALLGREGLTSIHLGHGVDETGSLCTWQVPLAHELETWGDQRAIDGTLAIQQPLIAPLWGARSALELLARVAGERNWRGHEVVRKTFRDAGNAASFERDWRAALHAGVVRGSTLAAETPAIDASRLTEALRGARAAGGEGVEVQFLPDAALWDGRHANNVWSQELADPMTKIVWDNVALVSRQFARDLGVRSQDLVRISKGERSIEVPVWVLPGHAEQSVTLTLGYGRTKAGRYVAVADGRPGATMGGGFRVEGLRDSESFYFGSGFTVAKAEGHYNVVQTQTHDNMEGRPIAIDATLAEYRRRPEFASYQTVEFVSTDPLWRQVNYDDQRVQPDNTQLPAVLHKWGMVIDLSSCTGCNACVIACQAENNIPAVGKYEVERGREMAWLRIDRYFVGSDANPQIALQPVACQHCEEAPCENVCPVNATAHSPEGLNDMAYNRCIGTRYCANNCPYKVRRFNYLDWHVRLDELIDEQTGNSAIPGFGYRAGADVANFPEERKMAFNPNVTVRMRGVMEKCSYCVQRIQGARIAARREQRVMRDGDVITACQSACPTSAITFGDLNDPESRVSQLSARDRRYKLLAEIGTQPRTTFLGKIRNPNPAFPAPAGGGDGEHAAGEGQEAHG